MQFFDERCSINWTSIEIPMDSFQGGIVSKKNIPFSALTMAIDNSDFRKQAC